MNYEEESTATAELKQAAARPAARAAETERRAAQAETERARAEAQGEEWKGRVLDSRTHEAAVGHSADIARERGAAGV